MDNIFSWGSDPTYTSKLVDYLPISQEDSIDPRRMNMVELVVNGWVYSENGIFLGNE